MTLNAINILYAFFLLTAIIMYGLALKTNKFYVRLIFIYLVMALLVTITAFVIIVYAGLKNNLFLFHIFTPLEYLLLGMLFSNIINAPVSKKIILISVPVFIVVSILFSVFIQHMDENNSYVTLIECTLIIFWSLLYLRELLLRKQEKKLSTFPLFWISAALLVYFTETLVIEGLLNYMIKYSPSIALQAYRLTYILKYLLFVSLTIAAYFELKQYRSNMSI